MSTRARPGNASGALDVTLAGEPVRLLAERALFVRRTRTLVVADLHWGKSEAFRALGVPIPGGVLEDDLARLGRALGRSEARRLVVLGDLVHAREGVTDALVRRVRAWRRDRPLPALLVRGNHDRHLPELPESWEIEERAEPLQEGPLLWMHDTDEPASREAGEGVHRVGGHLHPRVALAARGDALRLPAYVLERARTLLPAFSAFTAGVCFPRARGRRLVAVAGERLVDLGGG